MGPPLGADLIARTLKSLNVEVVFGIVGVPVVEVAEACTNQGIRFIGFRNEQSCSYAASGYGYLTGRPGVLLVVGGPGVVHAMAGIANAMANAFPLMVMGGSIQTYNWTKGDFQEMDHVALLNPHTKLAIKPHAVAGIPAAIRNCYRTAFYGRPGATFVDLPGDYIHTPITNDKELETLLRDGQKAVADPPRTLADPERIKKAAALLKSAKAPLLVVGKGAAYSRAETVARHLVQRYNIPFLPSPMGKGLIPDSSPLNTSVARSQALKGADVIIFAGARLNWILAYGEPPKFSPTATFIQIDLAAEELGASGGGRIGSEEFGLQGDAAAVLGQLVDSLGSWQGYNLSASPYWSSISSITKTNLAKSAKKSAERELPMTFESAYDVIRTELDALAASTSRDVVMVSEGSRTMDLGRAAFPMEHARHKLDAGTLATMGLGLGYSIAAHAAYGAQKKIVAVIGDSAVGFAAMELETAARANMDILVIVMNNSGIYDGVDVRRFAELKAVNKLPATALTTATRYDGIAEAVGGRGWLVSDYDGLRKAVGEAWRTQGTVSVVNVLTKVGEMSLLDLQWLNEKAKAKI